ncbi:MAG TPA: ATP-binding protein, partial [Flavobacteriaceae bacterium]|nr:ATP-binding protein [Flavobacteriaceae bacterium]
QTVYNKSEIYYGFLFSGGSINVIALEPLTKEELDVGSRFANVFGLLYRRFLDLQKAEAQAREAQIEASLERIRAQSMAMHNSNELLEVIDVIAQQLEHLEIRYNNISLGPKIQDGPLKFWVAGVKMDSTFVIDIPNIDHPATNRVREAQNKGIFFFTDVLTKEENKIWFKHIIDHADAEIFPKEIQEKVLNSPGFARSTFLLNSINLYLGNYYAEPYTEEENAIIGRFAKVFEQAYTRFLDLQKAEAQAREAIKQASLDRVRGEIASMRTSEDLNRITPVIWHELQALEVPFIRCGVFIVEEEKEKVRLYLNTPDGNALGVLNLSFDENELTSNTVKHWKKKQVYKAHWTKEEFIEWTKSMMKLGQVKSAEKYQGSASAPEALNLHFVPFNQGMLYVGNVSLLTDDKIDLVKTLADAFSTAYARYEDFNKLETAKQQVENTLTDLKQTQQQLVQSEKMASLGELTAGIAHEIQNPLNFVNNFSEVSKELLEEMMEELKNGDTKEVEAIASDIIENLEKINHHGKRADGIVKGMLQHSRTSTGIKEPTDINVLADEYFRLAYHGLRAKDKSFNAVMKTDFDKSIDKIDVIAQDIGRVILNLITNAFYAVIEKKKQLKSKASEDSYEPTVLVSTKKMGNYVEVCVKDNGNGIPQKVVDKIFQPFFTTKPTGQGTGLGLSLSYDIIKAHGGEIKVDTKEGKGTTFIIKLPKN